MRLKKLLRKNIEPRCTYCAHGSPLADDFLRGVSVGQDDPSCRFGERTAFLRSVSVGRAAHGPPYNDEKRVSGYAAAMQWSDRGFLRRITKGEDKTSPFLCNYCSPYA